MSVNRNNKRDTGFTLIELIIAIVVSTIVVLAVTGFILNLYKQYSSNAAKTLLTAEATKISSRIDSDIQTSKGLMSDFNSPTDTYGPPSTDYEWLGSSTQLVLAFASHGSSKQCLDSGCATYFDTVVYYLRGETLYRRLIPSTQTGNSQTIVSCADNGFSDGGCPGDTVISSNVESVNFAYKTKSGDDSVPLYSASLVQFTIQLHQNQGGHEIEATSEMSTTVASKNRLFVYTTPSPVPEPCHTPNAPTTTTYSIPGTYTYVIHDCKQVVSATLVGGGGGGGGGFWSGGGGGGGGRIVQINGLTLDPGTYTIVVGTGGSAGAAGGTGSSNNATDGGNGGNTTFANSTALGGQGGKKGNPNVSASSGAGGYGGASATSGCAGSNYYIYFAQRGGGGGGGSQSGACTAGFNGEGGIGAPGVGGLSGGGGGGDGKDGASVGASSVYPGGGGGGGTSYSLTNPYHQAGASGHSGEVVIMSVQYH